MIRIRLPPLRERLEDIPMLAAHFLQKHSALEGKRLSFSAEAMQWIVQQQYPGNVRELENVVERAAILARSEIVEPDDLPPHVAVGLQLGPSPALSGQEHSRTPSACTSSRRSSGSGAITPGPRKRSASDAPRCGGSSRSTASIGNRPPDRKGTPADVASPRT